MTREKTTLSQLASFLFKSVDILRNKMAASPTPLAGHLSTETLSAEQ